MTTNFVIERSFLIQIRMKPKVSMQKFINCGLSQRRETLGSTLLPATMQLDPIYLHHFNPPPLCAVHAYCNALLLISVIQLNLEFALNFAYNYASGTINLIAISSFHSRLLNKCDFHLL